MQNTVIGKAEGSPQDWHGHVTAITVAPEYRRLGLARKMMALLERVSDDVLHGWFVDLFVRVSNKTAIQMYEKLGYSVYRRIKAYYEGKDGTSDEDAFGEVFFFCRVWLLNRGFLSFFLSFDLF